MAERVDIRRESKTREAITSILKTHKIINDQDIRIVMQKWEHYDYKICGVTRNLSDFCDYVKYQETLLQLINKKTIKPSVKEALVRFFISDIKKLIQSCMDTPAYQGEVDMFLLKLSFCRLTEDFTVGTATVHRLVKAHPSNSKVWHEAAKWFLCMHKPNDAICILQQGLEMLGNPVNIEIYLFLVSLEINAALGKYESKAPTQKELQARKDNLFSRLDVYVTDFEDRTFTDSAFLFIILDKFNDLEVEKATIERVKKLIADKFGTSSQTWQLLAQRDLIDAERGAGDQAACIIERYETGLVKLAAIPEQCSLLWSAYLDFLLDMITRLSLFNYAQANKYLQDAFKKAEECNMLDEKYYLDWFDFTTDEEFEIILDRSLLKYPLSIELWNVKINCELMRHGKDQQRILNIFDKATEICGESGIEIWNSMLRHVYVMWDSDQVETIFRKGIHSDKQPVAITNELKPRFIEWLAVAKDSDVAIREYNILSEQEPYCKRLHDVALTLRSFTTNREIVLKAHRLLCEQFSKDSNVYLRFVRYHYLLNHTESIMPRKAAIQSIYQEARTNLDDKEFDVFLKQFNELKGQEMAFTPNMMSSGVTA